MSNGSLVDLETERQPAGPAPPGWTCPSCQEVNEGQFGQCWNCGARVWTPES